MSVAAAAAAAAAGCGTPPSALVSPLSAPAIAHAHTSSVCFCSYPMFTPDSPSASSGAPHPTNFANVEDMLFEVFRCEETDAIDRIAIAQFLNVRR